MRWNGSFCETYIDVGLLWRFIESLKAMTSGDLTFGHNACIYNLWNILHDNILVLCRLDPSFGGHRSRYINYKRYHFRKLGGSF